MATHKEKAEDLLKNFTDELINQIENNNAPWQVPWSPTEHNFTLPVNKEGTLYQGRNMMLLLSSAIKNGYTDDRWYTFNAAKELGVKVKKGEKASQIVRWQYTEERLKLDENGKKIIGEDGKPIKEIHRLDFPKGPFIHYVFNANQIEGLAPKEPPKRLEAWERHEMAENIIKNAQKDGIDIVHRAIDRAYYNPEKDQIVMPERHQFATADLYYATLLHEIGHATGHEKRLNRDLSGGFGSESYAKEELRAEISSMIIGQTLQIGHDTTQHQSYLKSWVKIVKEDPNAIFEAVKEAEKIKEYVLGLNKELELKKGQELKSQDLPKKDMKDKMMENFNTQTERDYIYAPYEDKDKVKALGAKYDPDVKMWYVPEGVDKAKFSQWTTKPQAEYASPEYEFKKFLQSFGADIPAGHPIADGKWHSLHIQGDKSNSKKGGYIVTEENGVWRGSFNNFKTGQTAYFSSKSHSHTFTPPEEIERIQRERAEAQAKLYAHTAQSAQKILAAAQPATNYPYLTKKGVQAHGLYIVPQPETAVQDGNIRIARDWREAKSMREHFKENGDRISVLTAGDLMIPAYDKDGNVTTIQTIGRDKNSFKSFLTDGQKAGSFLVLGQPKNNEAILIAEGYATAATLYEQLNKPVIVAFDAGNLKSVALTVREHFPDSVLYMAADNDHKTAREREALGHTSNLNTGIEKATEAAVAVGGYVVAPKFSEHDSGSDWNDVLKDKGVVELRDQFRTQLVDIGLQRNLDLSIKKVEFADKEIQRVQETVMLTAFKDKDKIIQDYALHEKTFEGRYIASDMMKEMFSQYSQSQETRNKHNNAVHNTAAALAAKHFNDMLDKPIENGRDTVVFLTGSPGAGKTTTVLNKGQLKDNVAVVFEGQLANAHQNPASMDKIQKALERGFKVEIVAVNPLPEQALDNTFKRFYDPADGRGSSIATMARIQGNTYDGLKAVHNTFGNSVGLTIIDKPNGNNGKVEYTGWQHLDVLKSQGTEAQIKERLTTHLIKQYEIGVINDECFKQAAGSEHKQLAERMAERGSRAFSQDESRREFSSGSGSTSNQLGERENARTSSEIGRVGGTESQLPETESGLHRPHRQPANAIGRGGSEPARAGGTYTGHIISVGDDITLQKTGTGKIIVHQTKDLPGIQEQDTSSKLKIVYGANCKIAKISA
ncbi:ssDNA-binding domain-containing protein (plasmid) [Moraxella bovis]|uniref:zincin-like metallopeptidase domain-containing protein n=1 Tax=Moraxella bovis TaxID=476 RepID=UPI0022260256|nr:zincin-like metallopeptidase domain-containing protein [Moraxella bovis]UZA18164.1 ssDNA-binding domain-containing protein [Moraxella bovis]